MLTSSGGPIKSTWKVLQQIEDRSNSLFFYVCLNIVVGVLRLYELGNLTYQQTRNALSWIFLRLIC